MRRTKVIWTAVVGFLIFAMPIAGRAQGQAAEPRQTVYRLRVRAMATGRPALKNHLLPLAEERTQGNAATVYLMALLDLKLDDKDRERFSDWLKLPLGQFPTDEARRANGPKVMMDLVEMAARRDRCEWSTTAREQGFMTPLPHLRGLRDVSLFLALRARMQLREKDYAGALHTIQTGLAMAQDLNEDAVVIQQLVGAIVSMRMLDCMRDGMELEGFPNLYWPLANLPRPFHDVRKAMEWERPAMMRVFPGLSEANVGQMSEAQFREGLKQLRALVTTQNQGQDVLRDLGEILLPFRMYPEAKRFLIQRGMSKAEVEALPPHQAMALYMLRGYDEAGQEVHKWFGLPYWQGRAGMAAAEKELAKAVAENRSNLLLMVLPAVSRARYRVLVVDRQIASLMCVEAVRDYAGRNGGKLPGSLEELTETPAPQDPATGKPFKYEVRGDMAVIDAPTPEGEPADRGWRYEVTVIK